MYPGRVVPAVVVMLVAVTALKTFPSAGSYTKVPVAVPPSLNVTPVSVHVIGTA